MLKKIKDIKTGDKILGTDNKYHKVLDITPITIPSRMFEIEFSNGKVKCSFNHQWTYWINDLDFTVDTLSLFEDLLYYKENDCYFGKKEDKITLLSIKEIEPEEVLCITTDTSDGLFKIFTDKMRSIFTHNCTFRCFCGRASESGASLVALDNTLATTVDNSKPGAGIIQSAGNPVFVRYYFSKFEDIDDYYKKRGLDELGYGPGHSENELVLENLGGEEEIMTSSEDVSFEFEKEKAVIDKRENQNWEEI